MSDTTKPLDHVPKSLEQEAKPEKKVYRAPTSWHLRSKNRPRALEVFKILYNAVIEGVAAVDLGPLEMYEPKGESWKRGPVPTHPILPENIFILKWAFAPLILQWAFLTYSGYTIPPLKFEPTMSALGAFAIFLVQFLTYELLFILFAVNVLKRGQYWMQHYGTLNEEKRGRDIVPDSQHERVILGLITFIVIRGAGLFALVSDRTEMPSFSIFTPVKMALFLIALDYFFYTYHRTTHEVDALWFVHRQHHATKAPTPSMSLWADEWQDSLEWAIIPAFSFAVIKLSLAELYVTSCYLLYIEAFGHTGVRAYFAHPFLKPILKPFNVELAIEDHDLHHRYGRGGKNYGKQTRIWDTLFGTVAPREEVRNYNARHGTRLEWDQ